MCIVWIITLFHLEGGKLLGVTPATDVGCCAVNFVVDNERINVKRECSKDLRLKEL